MCYGRSLDYKPVSIALTARLVATVSVLHKTLSKVSTESILLDDLELTILQKDVRRNVPIIEEMETKQEQTNKVLQYF